MSCDRYTKYYKSHGAVCLFRSRRRHGVHGAPCDWGITFERFRFLAPCQRLRAIVCVLSAHLRRVLKSTCVCLRFREQCLRSEITSVSRVALVLLLRFVAGNMDVNTPASKRSQLIGNTAIVRKRCVIHTNSTCVCWRLSVATFTQKRKDASFDLWPP